MPEFICKVADSSGRVFEEREAAQSEQDVRRKLGERGLLVYSVTSGGGLVAQLVPALRPARRKTLSGSDFQIFNQQFVTLIRAGLPILKALDLLAERAAAESMRPTLRDIRDRVKEGATLSEAFEQQGGFDRVYTTSILAGERSGNLVGVLESYIAYQRVTSGFRKRLLGALIYPAFLVVAASGILTYVTTFVIPRFAELYKDLNVELPRITIIVTRLATDFRWEILGGVALIVLLIVFGMLWSRTEKGGYVTDRLTYRLPVLGSVWIKFQVAQLCRTLATLLQGGIPLVSSLETAAGAVRSRLFSQALLGSAESVRQGQPLSTGLQETRLIPPLALEMVQVGEASGSLGAMLASVADFYEEEVNTRLSTLVAVVEPSILIFMAAVVLVILIALYLPIFSIGASVQH
ncbi:MAG TPA: type II secretion system F family protein [Candidatus Acidoferrales bacterium]|nr:type II secretion system F family protein [Candidatus Acidoferrales bacterium]